MRTWLLSNTESGSYSVQALDRLARDIQDAGLELERTICFPDEALPSVACLNDAGVDLLAVFTGDGTINSAVSILGGWSGAVLALPGGTMNLLSHRLHGDAPASAIVECVARGDFRRVRRNAVHSRHGDAIVGFSAGPATRWYQVRETMRKSNMLETIEEMKEAFAHSLEDPWVRLSLPDRGDSGGYPLLEVVPTADGLEVTAFNPHGIGDYIQQGWFTLVRDFRKGPHTVLGSFAEVVLADIGGGELGISIDGEPMAGAPKEKLQVVEIDVDLIATTP